MFCVVHLASLKNASLVAPVRLVEVLKVIAGQCGFKVLACRVHDGDHVHVFVSAPPKVGIPMMVRVLKCNSARMLFVEFSALKLKLWGGQLWSDGYTLLHCR